MINSMDKSFFTAYFFDVIGRHYADFKGKAGRKEFWLFFLCSFIVALTVSLIGSLINPVVGSVLALLMGLALFIPQLALYVRRMHDIGKSGWWIFISFIPVAGAIWFLVLLCRKGESAGAKSKWNWLDTVIMVIAGLSIISLPVSYFLGNKSSSSWYDGIEESIGDIYADDTDTAEDSGILSESAEGADFSSVRTGDEKIYYIYDDPEFAYSNDLSRCYIVGTDKEGDVQARRDGYDGQKGDQTILVSNNPKKTDELSPLLSQSQLYARYDLPKDYTYFRLYPSSGYSNILYFNFVIACHQDGDVIYYGKIDDVTKDFSLFYGQIIGMIGEGSYNGCYVVLGDDNPRICRQSGAISDEGDEVVAVFNISDYFEGKDNYDLYDEDFRDTVIEWLENQ